MKSRMLLPALVFALSAQVFAVEPEGTVTATGEEAIISGDAPAAYERATKKAMREAVEQVIGVMIGSDTLTRNNSLVSDRIFSNSAGYVKHYEVVSKSDDGRVAKVTIKAQIAKADLDRDAQAVTAIIKRFGSPKLIILTQEQAIDANGVMTSSGVMSQVLTDGFKEDGWTLLDPHFASQKMHLSAGAALGQQEAKELGDISKADYILYGTVTFRYQPPSTGGLVPEKDEKGNQIMFAVTGEYEIGLFPTDSGTSIMKIAGKFDTDIGHAGKAISPIISYSRTAHDIAKWEGPKIVTQVRKKVLDYLSNAEQNGSRFVMNVIGISEYSKVEQFKRMLGEQSGVREVKPGTFAGGKAQFDVSFVGSTTDLADRLGGKSFKGKKIEVTGVTGNTMELTLAK